MSDSGTYVCRLLNGSERNTTLEVRPGCHNNLSVSFHQLNPSTLLLNCSHCPPQRKAGSFRWTFGSSSNPLGNREWAKKNNNGASVTLHPTTSIPQYVWGLWQCRSVANPTWGSEICLIPPTEAKDAGDFGIGGDFVSTKPTSSVPGWWTTAVTAGHDAKGSEVWIWTLLSAGLALMAIGLGMAMLFWKRGLIRRKYRRRKKEKEQLSLSPVRVLLHNNEEICNSLDEGSASLHYAQLQHPSRISSSIWASDSTTVYAVIV
ncbi:uncharacterized protein LOC128347324 [Hemicordylus capensis]|uniref:uncharacterized protein LOC128347324 n=1 Tax=Hemicordylus capensis TaxID=884348 RepID=UPI0023029F73|nr:uncharacterized protein LOC128347324 [Hemicordylus capensis]XP_053157766.1 uncharacterized protein LOC128347324 [Hemicordylus capensis]